MSEQLRGSLYAIISGFLYGFLGYFGLSAIKQELSISSMLFWRFGIASLVLLCLLILQPKKQHFLSRHSCKAFFNGAVFYAFSTLLYFYACLYISSGLAMVLFFTYPMVVMLLNYGFYQQAISRYCYWSMMFIITGMGLTVDLQSMHFDVMGITLAIVSGAFYAGYIVSSKKVLLPPEISTLSVTLGCTLTFFILSILNQSLIFPKTPLIWANLFGIGIIATVIPVLLLLYSLKFIDSTKAAILSVLEPVFVVIFGVLLLNEVLKPALLAGIILILSGALISLFSDQRLIQSRGLRKSV